MKPYIYLSALFFTLVACKATQVITEEFNPSFEVSRKTTHKIKKGQAYTFGYLEVPENRNKANSNKIKLPVYIFKSRSKSPKKDPIIYTVGGPGYSTMSSAQYMNYYKYLDDRDFILFEQRGNYYAKPHLGCPEWSQAVYQSNLPGLEEKEIDGLFAEAVKACRDRLTKEGIDLDAYNTNEIAADINDLVSVLGIESYNLLTISYSTKIAQVLMRDYPDRIRSVVMDSPLPLESSYDEESVQNLLETVERFLDDCELNEACKAAFPNLKARFFDYLMEKTERPLQVEVENPKNGKMETFYLTGADLIGVFSLAYTEDVVNIPFEINKLLNGDLSSVKEQLASLFQGPGNGAGKGMRLSVWCAEEYPFNSQAIIEAETNKYPEVKGLTPETFSKEVCEIWRVKKVADIENQAVRSDIPVLLISGEYDELTPAKWAKSMMNTLSNSHHLIFKGWKHTPTTYWSNPCGMQAANDFFNNPRAKPKPACFEKIGSPNFRTE
ncbi:MAG: alpha/beta fold hydrolase [Bacteroidota bacterium]